MNPPFKVPHHSTREARALARAMNRDAHNAIEFGRHLPSDAIYIVWHLNKVQAQRMGVYRVKQRPITRQRYLSLYRKSLVRSVA